MRWSTLLRSDVAALLLCATSPAREPAQQHVERIADGVYAVIRHDPIAYANNANSLLIVRDREVVVVDAQFTRAATLEVLAALRRITAKPVRYVVNTHWHDDHVAGNQVYRDTFPAVEFIAQEHTREDLVALGRENRQATVHVAPAYTARLERLLARSLGADSTPLVPLERAALTSTVAIARQYAAEAPGFRETLPDVLFRDTLMLRGGGRTIVLRYFGPANTRGDAVVWLPHERVVATGDLVVAPVPFAFASHPASWARALDAIDALHPAAIVPGHGPLMRDDTYLRQVAAMLHTIDDQVTAAVARGMGAADVQPSVTLDDARRRVAGDDKWLRTLFERFFLAPAIAGAYADATSAAGAVAR